MGDTEPDPRWLVFPTRNGTPQRRSNFHRQVWRPALVRAGLLGSVEELGGAWQGSLAGQFRSDTAPGVSDRAGGTRAHRRARRERLAVHDLRLSYATWLASDGCR